MLPDVEELENMGKFVLGLNAPTGAWCSLTEGRLQQYQAAEGVSMHLQVRGAP
mgnify:FL=1